MKCKHFRIEELVDPETHRVFGEKSWWFFDEKLLRVIDRLRENLGQPITANNWLWGGNYTWRGLRTLDCGIGADYSQHRLGKALDFTVRNMTSCEVRKHILDNIADYPEIKGLELKTSWVHIDVRNAENLITFGG